MHNQRQANQKKKKNSQPKSYRCVKFKTFLGYQPAAAAVLLGAAAAAATSRMLACWWPGSVRVHVFLFGWLYPFSEL